ncbi:unnamed protein product [Alopecurus aequalis]
MEATVVSLGKAVLDGALGYARSKAAEEVALQLGVEGDVAFIADELEMMRSFLMAADEERGQGKVLATWVKHVRDLAYNVEDSLMDFSLLSEKSKSWWCNLRTVGERRCIAKEIKDLRAKVEAVSNRNLRYRLVDESSGSKPTVAEEQASIPTAALFGINEARLAALEREKSSEVNLHQLITSNCMDLKVIAVWGTTGDLGKTSAIQEVYDDPTIVSNFRFRAWVRLTHPFNPKEFIHGLVRQFYELFPENLGQKRKKETTGSNVLIKMENMSQSEIIDVFDTQVNDSSYLIVIDDLSTIVEWSCIKRFFPDNKKRSRIIVCRQQAEIASLCSEQPYQVSELKQLSSDQTLYLFHEKINSEERVSMAGAGVAMLDINKAKLAAMEMEKLKAMHPSCRVEPIPVSNKVTTAEKHTTLPTSEIQEEYQKPKNADDDKVCNSTSGRKFDPSRTLALDDEVLFGRETEKSIIIRLVGQADNNRDYGIKYNLEGLKDDAALDFFIKKVFKEKNEKSDIVPAMMEQARLVLKKCDGLPLAISTIGSLLLRPQIVDDDLNRSDVVNLHRFGMANLDRAVELLFAVRGVQIPRGAGKLKALQTLRHVYIARGKGKVAVKELKERTQLRKLGVVGVTTKNSMVFWSAIAGLSQLRSLSVHADTRYDELDGCLGEGSWPPSCLESLKLNCKLVRMTAWIHQLQNLNKLTLEDSNLQQDDDAIQALGVLPNLAVLRLKARSFMGEQLHFQNSSFPSLVVLELYDLCNLESVLFEEGAVPRLELLQVSWCYSLQKISGLPVLTSLREIRLGDHELKEEVQRGR